MLPLKIKTCILTLSVAFFLSSAQGQDRKINAEPHPGCQMCTDNDTLMYIRAEGAHDTIHQIWDFTRGIPTIILAVAGVNSSMTITWERTHPTKFNLSETPQYSFATAIDKLYEYNDVNDNGYIDNDSEQRPILLSRATWWAQDMVWTEQEVMVQLRGHVKDHGRRGIIEMKLDMLPFIDYAVQLPHLIHSSNSSLLDIALVNFTTSRDFNSSRYALNLLVVSQDPSDGNMTTTVRKSLDDEHTPGVFEIMEVRSPSSVRSEAGGFLQFRPVCYTQAQRTVGSSTRVHLAAPTRAYIPERSTLDAYFSTLSRPLLVQSLRVSFGETADGFYARHNYTAWSSTIGYGSPPLEGFSPFVIGMLACGLGAPVLLLLAAGGYALARRRAANGAHSRLTDTH